MFTSWYDGDDRPSEILVRFTDIQSYLYILLVHIDDTILYYYNWRFSTHRENMKYRFPGRNIIIVAASCQKRPGEIWT